MGKIPKRRPLAKNTSSSSPFPRAGEEGEGLPPVLDPEAAKALRALGLTNPGTVPDANTALGDLLLYALTPHSGVRPDHGMVLGVAAELDALAMFVEGPLGVSLEMMARRIRASVDLARRSHPPPPPEAA